MLVATRSASTDDQYAERMARIALRLAVLRIAGRSRHHRPLSSFMRASPPASAAFGDARGTRRPRVARPSSARVSLLGLAA